MQLKLKLKEWKCETAVFYAALFIYTLWFSWYRLDLSPFWDEVKVYFLPLAKMNQGFIDYFREPLTLFHRPPGLNLLYLPLVKVFGTQVLPIRIFSLLIFLATMIFLKKILTHLSKFLAYGVISYFVLTPIIQVYSIQYAGEIQLSFIFVLVLWLLEKKEKYFTALIFLSCFAGTVRETSLVLVPATFTYFWMDRSLTKKHLLLCLGPFLGFASYQLLTYLRTNEFFHHLTITQGHIDLLRPFGARMDSLLNNFIIPFRLFHLLLLSLGFMVLSKKILFKPLMGFSFVIVSGYLFVFSGHVHVIPRYFIPAFPFLLILIFSPLANGLNVKRCVAFFVLAFIPALIMGEPGLKEHRPFHHFTGYQDTTLYPRVLELQEEALLKLAASVKPGSLVMTSWPFIEMIRSDWGPFKKLNYEIIWDWKDGERIPDVILWTNYPTQIPRNQVDKILKQESFAETTLSFRNYKLWLYVRD